MTVLCDEIYSRQLYDGEEHVSILQYDSMRERSIVLDGWSKTYAMTGWRLGYGVWPKHLIDYAERLQINSSSCANAVTQVAAIEALRGPQDAVDRMLAAFDERRKIIHAELKRFPGSAASCPKARSTPSEHPGTGIDKLDAGARAAQRRGRCVPLGLELRRLRRGVHALQLRQQRR